MFHPLVTLARRGLRRLGADLVRHRSLNTSLAHHGINVVLDVGANAGQYGTELRSLGYRGRIVSFEPQKTPFARLASATQHDANWEAVNIGLGSTDEQTEINVYQDSRLSSMLTFNGDYGVFQAGKVGTETIEVRALDSILDRYTKSDDKVLLKIDTQGFEKPVLDGAQRSLEKIIGVQVELSISPLYAGQPRMEEMIAYLRNKNFVLWQLLSGAALKDTGQELEADGLFFRPQNAHE